ncbi:hypothetical protein KPH14_003429 [Odynerus spinipes]|uniref:Odorant receptor n=1 Tax=Odynerus spinipes TaxID=1348599 RepID=A0AAD9VKN4_9HYME|nr:hypothetical protein KPH14_003429 [Odynerus spinipes]
MNIFTLGFDVELLLSTSMFFLPYLCIVAIYYTAYANKKKLKFLTECIIADWNELKPEELKIVEKYAAESRLLTRILIYSFYTPVVMMFILSAIPYISEDISSSKTDMPKFSYPVDVFIDKEKYPLVTILLVNLVIVTVGIISLANYTIFLVYVQHACAIFSVIGYILEHAVTEKQHDISRLIESNEIYLKIVRGIRYHKRVVEFTLDEAYEQTDRMLYTNKENNRISKSIIRSIRIHRRAIEFTEFINVIFEKPYLLQLVLSTFIVGINVLQLFKMRTNKEDTSDMIICLLQTFGTLFSGYVFHLICQSIIDHSMDIFEQAYITPWHMLYPKTQRLLLMLMMKSLKPCYISIGNMFVSCNEFYLTAKFLFDRMKNDWIEFKDTDEFYTVEYYAEQGRIYTMFSIVTFMTAAATIWLICLIPIIKDFVLPLNETQPRELPVPIELFIDTQKHYYVNFAIITLLIIGTVCVEIGSYSTFMMYAVHACGIFCITGFIDKINDIYKYNYLVQVTFALFVIAGEITCIIKPNILESDKGLTVINILNIVAILYLAFISCYIGQQVLDHSLSVFEKACTIPWYLLPPKQQSTLILIMMRSLKPSCFIIGKMGESSLELFATVRSTSISRLRPDNTY